MIVPGCDSLPPDCVDAGDCPDDGLFCTGDPSCTAGVCGYAGDQCSEAEICNEAEDRCDVCADDIECDDEDLCTVDSCDDGRCEATTVPCDDGLFCNGTETCTAETGCLDGDDPCDPDGEVCDETKDRCFIAPCVADAECDDGVYCNGGETCGSDGVCGGGEEPCGHSIEQCNEVDDACEPASCASAADCDDAVFCNGEETCTEGRCEAGVAPCSTDPCAQPTCVEEYELCSVAFVSLSATVERDRVIGTDCDDIFSAPLIFDSVGGQAPTFQTGDYFDGRGGDDRLDVTLNIADSTPLVATVIDIETLRITDFSSGLTVSGQDISGLRTVVNRDSTSPRLLVEELAEPVDCRIESTRSGLAVGFRAAATAGSADRIVLTLSDVSGGAFEMISDGENGIEELAIVSVDAPNTLREIIQPNSTSLDRVTISGDQDFILSEPLPATVSLIDATACTGNVSLSASAGAVTWLGGVGDDTLGGSPGDDVMEAGSGGDRVRPGLGVDTVDLGPGSDILDLGDLSEANLTSANRVTVLGLTANGTDYSVTNEVDAISVGDVATGSDLSDGAADEEFQEETIPGSPTLNVGVGVLELAWEFTPGVALDSALDGTALLAGLGAATGLTPGALNAAAAGDAFFVIAYQSDTAYLYFAADDDGDTGVAADELAIVVLSVGVPVGGFTASNFQP